MRALSVLVCTLILSTATSRAESYRDIEKRVTEHRLPNGLTFLFLPRGQAPVFSYATVVHAGAVNEQYGIGGLAHMMEHMAFKGTRTVGTTDAAAEEAALQRVDDAYVALLAERRKGVRADSALLADLTSVFRAAQQTAGEFVVANEFSKILDEHGAEGVNAGTGADQTVYTYALPSNKLELWAMLESDRMTNTVFREFYKENEVVQEERRMRVESSAGGRLMDEFLSAVYKEHPYGHGLIGTPSDLKSFTRMDGARFWDTYYLANNMTVAVVGDVDVERAKGIVTQYFSVVPSGPEPPPVITAEPPQAAERRVILEDAAQPFLVVAYHVPDENHPDFLACKAVMDVLAGGRSSRAYTRLVKESQQAVQVGGFVGYPGSQYSTVALVFAVASTGTDIHDLETALHEVASSMTSDPITKEELDGHKARAKAQFLRQLRSDEGLAMQLAHFQEFQGGWRNLFTHLDRVDALTTADCSRVAADMLRRNNRTVGIIEPPAQDQ
ncbi:MAG: insulinase family protein [Candidatus Eisenbacteria bacterium]|jgi:predicted Zn-dependent peptidase|nr:insulinase family protein [Candidatus Eisenbacteria bacterium]